MGRHRVETAVRRLWLRHRLAALGVVVAATFVASAGTLVAYFEAGGNMPPPRSLSTAGGDIGPSVGAQNDPSSAPGPK